MIPMAGAEYVEVVVKLPKEILEIAQQDKWKWPADDVYKAIKEGTIIPKGHRIADMDEAIKCIQEVKGEDAAWAIALIEWACSKRTIIEADKVERKE